MNASPYGYCPTCGAPPERRGHPPPHPTRHEVTVTTWTFDPRLGGSRRYDGVYFHPTTNYTRDVTPLDGPDWVWLVHWPNPTMPPVWIDPVKRGVETPADVEAYIDAKWPPPTP